MATTQQQDQQYEQEYHRAFQIDRDRHMVDTLRSDRVGDLEGALADMRYSMEQSFGPESVLTPNQAQAIDAAKKAEMTAPIPENFFKQTVETAQQVIQQPVVNDELDVEAITAAAYQVHDESETNNGADYSAV